VSNGNAAAGLMMTVAVLTGMSQVHGSPARRHVTSRHWSSPERVELGDARIPVRSVHDVRSVRTRTRTPDRTREPARPRIVRREPAGPEGKAAPEDAAAPEVIVGYVDPRRGPAAFHRLAKVTEGDRVKVVRKDHSIAWFKVDSVRRAIRRDLARERSASGRPELRLISAGGKKKDPRDVVVSAHLDAPTTQESPQSR
jgi:hypothetical protein